MTSVVPDQEASEPAAGAASSDVVNPRAPALEVAAFTGGKTTPGARFRVRQYFSALRALGVSIVEWPSRAGQYPPPERSRRPLWALHNLSSRLLDLARARARQTDVTLLQREFLSTLVTLEPLTRRPRVLDVDDAIWLYGGDTFARRLARLCDLILCGNSFLAERFAEWHPRVETLPTAVDTDRFRPLAGGPDHARPIIGWTGTGSTLFYLHAIEGALRELLRLHPHAVLRVVCDRPPRLVSLPPERVDFVRWSPDVEVASIQSMTVGLMPLDDSVAARGKCSLKMLLYMACGLPVVVTPVGSNCDVLAAGDVGLAASTQDEWVQSIDALLRDPERAGSIGVCGRSVVAERYSVSAIAPRLAALLKRVA